MQSVKDCPICLLTLSSTYMTKCGHNFCYKCISTQLSIKPNCPVCQEQLDMTQIFPNFLLDQMIAQSVAVLKRPRDEKDELLDELFQVFLEKTRASKEQKISEIQKQLELIEQEMPSEVNRSRNLAPMNMLAERQSNEISRKSEDHGLSKFAADALDNHLIDLQESFFEAKTKGSFDKDSFTKTLYNVSKYSKFKELGTLDYADSVYNQSSLISAIDFDCDDEFFVTGGVLRKIKIYNYESVVSSSDLFQKASEIDHKRNVYQRYPIAEIKTSGKLSSLCFNRYMKSSLLSGDYEGVVTLYDTALAVALTKFEEHEKRCWSVDFSKLKPTLFASAGDDGRVKLWDMNCKHSVNSIKGRVNICSVKFNGNSLWVGSADHNVYQYDLRKLDTPTTILKGHQKAVSYVTFCNGNLVSMSTDSTVRLWNNSTTVRKFDSHLNVKNFVGVSCWKSFIACGSESNKLHVYEAGASKPIVNYQFDSRGDPLTGRSATENNGFISSVCWKRNEGDVLIAGNSFGRVKILQMV